MTEELDPLWSPCIAGASQGIDPFMTLTPGELSGPGGPPTRRHKRAAYGHDPERDRLAPRAAAATTTAAIW